MKDTNFEWYKYFRKSKLKTFTPKSPRVLALEGTIHQQDEGKDFSLAASGPVASVHFFEDSYIKCIIIKQHKYFLRFPTIMAKSFFLPPTELLIIIRWHVAALHMCWTQLSRDTWGIYLMRISYIRPHGRPLALYMIFSFIKVEIYSLSSESANVAKDALHLRQKWQCSSWPFFNSNGVRQHLKQRHSCLIIGDMF